MPPALPVEPPEDRRRPERADVAPPERCLICGGRHHSRLIPDGRRMLTVYQVAAHLSISEKTVRKLIAMQWAEERVAARAGRPPELVGLRANRYPSGNVIRIREGDVVVFQDRDG